MFVVYCRVAGASPNRGMPEVLRHQLELNGGELRNVPDDRGPERKGSGSSMGIPRGVSISGQR